MSVQALTPLAVQLAMLAGAAGLLIALPPAEGELLLVPIGAGAAARAVPLALAGGARLVARGPVAGSVVVRGRRAALWAPLTRAGVLVAAAPALACGGIGGVDGKR